MVKKNRKFTVTIQTRFDPETVEQMDLVIERQKFDDRPQFIRLAVNELISRRNKLES